MSEAKTFHILLGSQPWIAPDQTKPDGRWLVRDVQGRVTLMKRSGGVESIAFEPIDFAEALAIAHAVIDGDKRTITDPLSLAALAAAVAEIGLAAAQVRQEREAVHDRG